MLFSFAILPPVALAEPLAAIRSRLDPTHAPKTTPHITLKQPFVLTRTGQSQELVARITEACARVPSFEVCLQAVDMFESQAFGGVVHLRVELSAALHALQRALVLAVAELGLVGYEPEREVRLYYPHLTLAQGLTVSDARAAVERLGEVASSTFRAEHVVIGCCGDDGIWTIPHVLPLGSAEASC